MTLTDVKAYIIQSLTPLYDEQEAVAIANTLVSHVLNSAVHQSFDKMSPARLEPTDIGQIEGAVKRLIQQEPIQYVLEEAWFYNAPFYVNKHVLIPRPETEELVELILHSTPRMENTGFSILDIGTGSGCIPITLKQHLPNADVHGVDISEDALAVAQRNAHQHNVEIWFKRVDILQPDIELSDLDLIVSNPPYITEMEKTSMHPNVLEHEPHLALFVSNEQPLLFYDAITKFAAMQLKKKGQLFFEINAAYGKEVKACMENHKFSKVSIHKDMQGKDRFVSGILS